MRRILSFKPILSTVAALLIAAAAASQSPTDSENIASPPTAQQVIDVALATAREEQKNVLTHFGASWCSWCLHLDAMLESDEVGDLFHDNYVITHLTIQESDDKLALENPGAQELLDAAGGGNAGVPVYLFFDDEGNQLASSLAMPGGGNIGHPVTPPEIDAFLGLLEETAPRMTAADRNRVSDYLVNQQL